MSTHEEADAWIRSIPEGFQPVWRYPDGKEDDRVPVVGVIQWNNPAQDATRGSLVGPLRMDFLFAVNDLSDAPSLPFKGFGEIWTTGWDIPTRWVIDGERRAWMDNAHGHALERCTPERLVSESEDENYRNGLRRALGLSEAEPTWMVSARAAGWSPPAPRGLRADLPSVLAADNSVELPAFVREGLGVVPGQYVYFVAREGRFEVYSESMMDAALGGES
jgi:hypothetical protein